MKQLLLQSSWDVQKLDLCYQISGSGIITTDGTHKLPGCFTSFKWPGNEITGDHTRQPSKVNCTFVFPGQQAELV